MRARRSSTAASAVRRAALGPALAVCALAACYSYRVAPIDQVATGTAVRVRISPAEAARVGPILGREDRILEGELLAKEADNSFMVAVPTGSGADAAGAGPMHQRITIPRDGLVELEVRRLDKWRTAGVIAVGAVAATAVAAAAFGGLNSPFGLGKGDTDRMTPFGLFTIPVRFAP